MVYRTFGELNAAKTNAVLVTTSFQGTSAELAPRIGAGKLVDSSRYFVITVDALGNAVSSSPSNSALQPGASFPAFSIRDMVESQHRLLTRHLGIPRLHAVVGESMGGMQALQWAVAHPDFAVKTVSIVGSPQSQADDRQRWRTTVAEMKAEAGWRRALDRLWELSARDAFKELTLDERNFQAQAEAIANFDVAAPFGGSLAAAAAAVRSELLVVYARSDDRVNPDPAVMFAGMANGQLLELDGRCGHQAPTCERTTLWPAVDRFLASEVTRTAD
jgi:homoserine O-acetyltransferase